MVAQPDIDFRKHAESMGAIAAKVSSIGDLEARARGGQGERPHHGRRHRDRSADRHRSRRALVGRRGSGGVVARAKWSRRAKNTRSPAERQRHVQLSEARSLGDPVRPVAWKPKREGKPMSELRVRPKGTHGLVTEVTPESAGWTYVGFALHRLEPGESLAAETGAREVCLVLVSGKAQAHDRRQGFRRDRRTHEPVRRRRPGRPTPRPAAAMRLRR